MPDRDEKGRWLVGHAQPGPGRPPLYKDDVHPKRAYQLALAGKTNEQIAEVFDISVKQLYEWQAHYIAFRDALRSGRTIADGEAAEAAHIAINGGIVREMRTYKDAEGNIIKVVETVKEIPPDANAALKWLELRARGLWARQAQEENAPVEPQSLADLSDEELTRRRKELEARLRAREE